MKRYKLNKLALNTLANFALSCTTVPVDVLFKKFKGVFGWIYHIQALVFYQEICCPLLT